MQRGKAATYPRGIAGIWKEAEEAKRSTSRWTEKAERKTTKLEGARRSGIENLEAAEQ